MTANAAIPLRRVTSPWRENQNLAIRLGVIGTRDALPGVSAGLRDTPPFYELYIFLYGV